MRRSHLPKHPVPKDPEHLPVRPCDPTAPSGISLGFPRLSLSLGQLDYVLLARPPLYSPCGFHVRLACLIHAANVRSEPGSNPSLGSLFNPCCSSPHPSPASRQKTGGWLVGRYARSSTLLALTRSFEATQNAKDRCPAAPRGAQSRAGEGSELSSARQAQEQIFLSLRKSFAGST